MSEHGDREGVETEEVAPKYWARVFIDAVGMYTQQNTDPVDNQFLLDAVAAIKRGKLEITEDISTPHKYLKKYGPNY